MAQSPTSGAVKALQLELKKMMGEPVEGFQVKLSDDDNLFEWEVGIFGPPGTMYEGGYFKVLNLRCFPFNHTKNYFEFLQSKFFFVENLMHFLFS